MVLELGVAHLRYWRRKRLFSLGCLLCFCILGSFLYQKYNAPSPPGKVVSCRCYIQCFSELGRGGREGP